MELILVNLWRIEVRLNRWSIDEENLVDDRFSTTSINPNRITVDGRWDILYKIVKIKVLIMPE